MPKSGIPSIASRVGGVIGRSGPNGDSAVWTLNERSRDPYYDNVSLLLHMDGTNDSTTFTDSSKFAHTVTANGGAKVRTTESKFGGASAFFNASGDFLQIGDNDAFEFGSVDFTMEAWIWLTVNNKIHQIISKDSNSSRGFQFRVNHAGGVNSLQFVSFSSNSTLLLPTVNFAFATSTWYHVAVSRVGQVVSFFVDGALIGTGSAVATIQQTTINVRVGGINFTGIFADPMNGYIDELRVTKGVARYKSDFAVPERPFLP